MQDKMYDNEFVNSKENLTKNEESLNNEKELVLTNEPENVESYKRVDVDGGVLNNDADIAYFKAIQYNDIIENCLLGDFDSKGNYVVNPVIVEQLLKMKKVFVSAFEKSVFVESVREFEDYGKINFRLKWTNNKQGQKIVVLELLETISRVNGYFENTNHVALLGVAINDDTSTEAVYKYFNIVKKSEDDNDDGAEKEDNRDIIDIINRIAYFQIAKVGQRKFMAKYYKDAYEKKIALLSKSKRGAYLLEDFNKEYLYCKNNFFKEGDIEYYKYLNQLIDAIIERNIDFIKDDKELLQGIREANKQSAYVFKTTNDFAIKKTNEMKQQSVERQNANLEKNQVESPEVQKTATTTSQNNNSSNSKSSGKYNSEYLAAISHMVQGKEPKEEQKVKGHENLESNNVVDKLFNQANDLKEAVDKKVGENLFEVVNEVNKGATEESKDEARDETINNESLSLETDSEQNEMSEVEIESPINLM